MMRCSLYDRGAVRFVGIPQGQHTLLSDHQNAPATTADLELGGQHGGFQGLTQPDPIGNQDAGADLLQPLLGRDALIVGALHHRLVGAVDLRIVGDGAQALALQVEQRIGEVIAGVLEQLGLGWVMDLNRIL